MCRGPTELSSRLAASPSYVLSAPSCSTTGSQVVIFPPLKSCLALTFSSVLLTLCGAPYLQFIHLQAQANRDTPTLQDLCPISATRVKTRRFPPCCSQSPSHLPTEPCYKALCVCGCAPENTLQINKHQYHFYYLTTHQWCPTHLDPPSSDRSLVPPLLGTRPIVNSVPWLSASPPTPSWHLLQWFPHLPTLGSFLKK